MPSIPTASYPAFAEPRNSWGPAVRALTSDGRLTRREVASRLTSWATADEFRSDVLFQEAVRGLRRGRTPEGTPVQVTPAAQTALDGILKAFPGRLRLPVQNVAGYPFGEHSFQIRVVDLGQVVSFPGKIQKVFYGFTPAARAQYEANPDVPWFNAQGQAVAEGLLLPVLHHDGSYKGSLVMDPFTLDVPPGMNLVFKLGFDLHQVPTGSAQPTPQGYRETKTYFAEGPKPT